jgi:hypothetical protein
VTSTGSIHFKDHGSGEDAWVGVRVQGETIGLTSSLKADGDIEVLFGKAEAEALRDALNQALAAVGG